MIEVTEADMDFSKKKIIEMMGWGRFSGFTASSCGKCHKTANVINGDSGWFCVCGHFNVLPWTGSQIPYEKPDLGPGLNKIQSAYSKTKKEE